MGHLYIQAFTQSMLSSTILLKATARPAYFNCGEDSVSNKSNSYRRGIPKSTKYTGKEGVKVMLVPPLMPEVSVIHAQRVALDGTVRIDD